MTGIGLGLSFLTAVAFGWWACFVVAVGIAAMLMTVPRRAGLLASAVGIGLAAILGACRGEPPAEIGPPPWIDDVERVRGEVDDIPMATGRFQRFAVRVTAVAGENDTWTDASARICVTAPRYPEVDRGDGIQTIGRLRALLDEPRSVRAWLQSRGCGATLFSYTLDRRKPGEGLQHRASVIGRRLTESAVRAAPGDAGALMAGLVTGDDAALSSDRKRNFVATSTTHLTAVSGANLALLVGLGAGLGRVTLLHRRIVWQLAIVGLIWGYSLLTGMDPPILRAALVVTAALFAMRVGRRPDSITLMVLSAALIVAVEPQQMWRLAFQLSVVASLALAVVFGGSRPASGWALIRMGVLAVVTAQVVTLPIIFTFDSRASIAGIPTNLLVGPLVQLAFPLAMFASAIDLVGIPLSDFLFFPAEACSLAVLWIVDLCARAPSLKLGVLSQVQIALLGGAVAIVVTAVSAEGNAWIKRLPAATRRLTGSATVVWGTAVVVCALGLVVRSLLE